MLSVEDTIKGLGERLQGRPFLNPNLLSFRQVSIDSRQVTPGDLFFALRGERADGHDYIGQAIQQGAAGVVVQKILASLGLPAAEMPNIFTVDDTLASLQSLARYWRGRFKATVIGITGSVGKTSTKEMVASTLSRKFHVLKNEGNLNNEIGLPLTVLKLDENRDRVVLEMGTYGIGEIRILCEIALPQIGVVTNVGPSHLERMGSLENIAKAKAELVESLPEDGIAILNGDDALVRRMGQRTRTKTLFYGLEPSLDIWASDIESRGLEGMQFQLHYEGSSVTIRSPWLGRHSVYTALATAAVAFTQGLSPEEVVAGLQNPEARIRMLAIRGIKDTILIDDSYNASPASSLAALDLLAELDGRKIAVLGDMLELGPFEHEGHQLVGRRAAEVADSLIVVGPRARLIGQEALNRGLRDVEFAQSNEEASSWLLSTLRPGDFVLVKGSRAMVMEQIVERIKA